MEMGERNSMAGLIERLVAEGTHFDFFQAISLLEEEYRQRDGGADPLYSGRIRMEAHNSLAFPPGEIASVKSSPDGVRMLLSFMGLLGVSSPLPIYFSEYISRFPENSRAVQDFLAMFNHRIYALFYRAWKKYMVVKAGLHDPLTKRIAAIAGISPDTPLSEENLRLLSYCGVFSAKARGNAGLTALISDYFDGIPVSIQNWVPRWVPLSNLPSLGSNARLGVSAVAGTTMLDRAGGFRLTLGPLPRATYETFLPGTQKVKAAIALVEAYCADPLDYEIEVALQSTELIPVQLGAEAAALGITSSLGASELRSSVHSVIVAARRSC